jgi:hypothetical protein
VSGQSSFAPVFGEGSLVTISYSVNRSAKGVNSKLTTQVDYAGAMSAIRIIVQDLDGKIYEYDANSADISIGFWQGQPSPIDPLSNFDYSFSYQTKGLTVASGAAFPRFFAGSTPTVNFQLSLYAIELGLAPSYINSNKLSRVQPELGLSNYSQSKALNLMFFVPNIGGYVAPIQIDAIAVAP